MSFAQGKRDDHLVPSIHKCNLVLLQVGTIRTRTSITSFTLTNHAPKTTITESSPLSHNQSLSQQELLPEQIIMDKNNLDSNNASGYSDNLGVGNTDTNDGQRGAIPRQPKSPPPSQPAPPRNSSFETKKKRVRFFQSQLRAARKTPIRPRQRGAKAMKPASSAKIARTAPTTAASRKRKAYPLDKTIQQKEQQQKRRQQSKSEQSGTLDPIGISHLSFPMRVRIVIEKCELERAQRRNNRKSMGTTTADKQGENNSAAHKRTIIGWKFDGKAFKIYDKERFVREIMPSYFIERSDTKSRDQVSFKDFQKSLSLWGFTDMPCVEGPTTRITHTCSHPSFVRDNPHASSTLRHWKSIYPVTE